MLQQYPHEIDVPVLAGDVKRRQTPCLPGIDLGPVIDQQLDRARPLKVHGKVQGCVARPNSRVEVHRLVHLNLGVQEILDQIAAVLHAGHVEEPEAAARVWVQKLLVEGAEQGVDYLLSLRQACDWKS